MQEWFIDFAETIADGAPFYLECEDCGQPALPPRSICPECGTRTLLEKPLSETATVSSYTSITSTIPTFSDDVPYTVVLATFDEGVRLTGQLRGAEEIERGDAVELGVEERADGYWLVTFTPAEA